MSPPPALFTGLGCAFSIFLSSAGACWASVPSGIYAAQADEGILSFAPIVISGVLGIYGLIVAVVIAGRLSADTDLTAVDGYKDLAAGLAVGLSCIASGGAIASFVHRHMEISKVSVSSVVNRRADDPENEQMAPLLATTNALPLALETTWKFIMVLVFMEAIALYGLVVALLLVGFL